MEIRWHGKTCFSIDNKEAKVVTDPYEGAGKLKGNIVLSSNEGVDAVDKVEGDPKIVDWPGEYEVSGVPVTAVKVVNTNIFYFEVSGVKMCHMGDLAVVPASEVLKEIGDIDVLMIAVGEGMRLGNKQVMEIIENIDPKIVLAMGSESPAAALKSLGVDNVEPIDKLEIKSKSDLPVENMRYVALNLAG